MVALLAGLGFTGASQAALWARGTDMVYDDVNKITWVQNTNLFQTQAASNSNLVNQIIATIGTVNDAPYGLNHYTGVQSLNTGDFNVVDGKMSWWGAQAWTKSLEFGGYTDWRLPSIDELYTQFQVNLGQVAGLTINISHNSNFSLFSNIQYGYWSSDTVTGVPELARTFYASIGLQNYASYKEYPHLAWAVRPGDVAAVPVPAAVWLFGSGLIGLATFTRRKNKTANLIAA